MKKTIAFLFTLSCILTMAQKKFNFDEQWQLIEKQEQNGLLKTNLSNVEQIYNEAKKTHHTPQIIKSLLYQSKILLQTSDDKEIERQIIENFEREIKETQGINRAVLQSLLAELYFSYYRNNQWEINQRTKTEETTGSDFRYWSENIFQQTSADLYNQSIENAKALQNEPIQNWHYILIKVNETESLRPTLYDFLAHRAIDFFKSENQHYFINNFNPTTSREKEISEILKNLMDFHQQKNNQQAYLYNALEKIKFENEDPFSDAFLNELVQLTTIFPTADYNAYILSEIADFYLNRAVNEEEKAFAAKKNWTEKARTIFAEIRSKYPTSTVISNIEEMEKEILNPYFELTIEKYFSPEIDQPFRLVHKNLDKVYFKVFTYENDQLIQSIQNANDKNKQKAIDEVLSKLRLVKEFQLNLKTFDDYQAHATVAKFDKLKAGKYLVLASNHANFKVNDQFILQSQIVNVSNYSISTRNNQILVTERETGKTLAHQNVEIYQNNQKGLQLIQTLTTDEKGMASIHSLDFGQNLTMKIKGENVDYSSYVYMPRNERQKTERTLTQFFTDRAIYRPGQTVYFKAIAYEIDANDKKNVMPQKNLNIGLRNTNGEELSTIQLKTNEFGSVSGEFILPISGMTGEFYLEDNNGNTHFFSVEEYKRPRFEVEFDEIKDVFKLEEKITAKGKAMTFSGANIDHAKVIYRVYRQEIFPYWPWWKRNYYPNTATEEISFGETTTDAEGKFEISFEAKVSTKKQDNSPRTYTYNVVAEITDNNGETQTAEQSITVGDLRYVLNFNLGEKIELSTLKSIEILTKNLNGQFAAAKGKITLTKINPPQRILRNSLIQKGDYELYDQKTFVQLFPHEAYADENEKYNWEKEKPVLSTDFDTEKSTALAIQTTDWAEGHYILNGFIQDGKDTIETEQLIYLYKNDQKNPIDHQLFSIHLDKRTYAPGETAKVQLASAAQDGEVLVELEHQGKIIKSEVIQLNNNVKNFSFPIEESYRGNVFVHYYFGKFNTANQGTLTVNVPFEDNSLQISAATLRDKLQPGQKETWELTVSGKGKDRFLAEMLATMYDASLDQFRSNSLSFQTNENYNYSSLQNWNTYQSFSTTVFQNLYNKNNDYFSRNILAFDQLNWFGFSWNRYTPMYQMRLKSNAAPEYEISDALAGQASGVILQEEIAEMSDAMSEPKTTENTSDTKLDQVVARRALQETAFFYPNLKTDENGHIKIQFTTPESLTAWKFMAMAHTPELRTGYFETTVRTQKELMVVPNPPRFLREGDQITFSSKVTNLSDQALKGQAKLMLFDAFSMQAIDAEFGNSNATQNIDIPKGNSTTVNWQLKIPKTHQAIVYRVVASAGDFSDGEESALPILSNRMMVTETLPIHVREGQNKTFTLDKLKNNHSKTLDHFQLTFEMTTDPIWYAIFSLPYLREYPYDCSEQVFARLYANLISQHLMNSNPKIKAVFDDWNAKGELQSKLEQNQELKNILLEETPWIRQSENEEEQMKRIALLFDLNKMQNEWTTTFDQLKNKQSRNGGFPWFEGGEESRYITTHIVSGFGHLNEMGIDLNSKLDKNADDILAEAIRFIDQEMEKEFDQYLKNKKLTPSNYNGIQYLYARSYFLKKYPLTKKGNQIRDYFLKEFNPNKNQESLQTQAMLAMIFNRFGEKSKAESLLKSIKDHAVQSDEMGMYWKNNVSGWLWYQAPIETQALLIEAFDEVLNDVESVESMKVWLLKNRQTNQWNSTKATTEAVFALMSTGKDWTNAEEGIAVKIGHQMLDLKALENTSQNGSGYVKTSWNASEIQNEMGEIEVEKTSPGVAWGAMYWQYFEDLDQITSAETGIQFKKTLFLKKNSDKGPILTKITENTPIKIGDLVTVRLEIQTDRNMEFVHIKDMRASGLEPTNVLSTYKRQGRLGYYESTRDAATNFFIDVMPKGNYVFEYDVRANNAGNFSNGITSMQNMYAPELSAHSEGIRIKIK